MKQTIYHIQTLEDLLELNDKQVERWFHDLKEWLVFRRKLKALNPILQGIVEPEPGMKWIDDGDTGVKHVTFSLKENKHGS